MLRNPLRSTVRDSSQPAAGLSAGKALLAGALAFAAGSAVWIALEDSDAERPPAAVRSDASGVGDDLPLQRRPVSVPEDTPPPASPAPAEVEASGRASLIGTVADPRGRPLVGAHVQLLWFHGELLATADTVLPSGVDSSVRFGSRTTEAEGGFRFDEVPARGLYAVRVEVPGRPPMVRLELRRPAPESTLDLGTLRFREPRELRLRAEDPAGRPLRDAVVEPAPSVAALDYLSEQYGELGGLLSAAVDPRGMRGGGRSGVIVRRGSELAMLQVPRFVREATAALGALQVSADPSRRGELRFPLDTDAGQQALIVSAPGFESRRVELEAGPTPVTEFGSVVLRPLEARRVRVVDADGAPVPGAELRVAWPDAVATTVAVARPAGRTDSEGTSQVHVPEGARFWLAARDASGGPWTVRDVPYAGRGEVVSRLPRSFDLRLRVTDLRGSGLDGSAEVRLLPRPPVEADSTAILLHQLGALAELPIDVQSNADDPRDYLLRGVPAGRHLLIVGSPGRTTALQSLDVVGARTVPVRLEASVPAQAAVQEGRGVKLGAELSAFGSLPRPSHVLPVRLPEPVDGIVLAAGPPGEELPVAVVDERHGVGDVTLDSSRRGERVRHVGTGVLAGRASIARHGARSATGDRAGVGPSVAVARRVSVDPAGAAPSARSEGVRAAVLPDVPVFAPIDGAGGFEFPQLEAGLWELEVVSIPVGRFDASTLLELLLPDVDGAEAWRRPRTLARVRGGQRTSVAIAPQLPSQVVAAPSDADDGAAAEPAPPGIAVAIDGSLATGLSVWIAPDDGTPRSRRTDASGFVAFDGELAASLAGPFELTVPELGSRSASGPPSTWAYQRRFEQLPETRRIEIALRTAPWTATLRDPGGKRVAAAGGWLEVSGPVAGEPEGGACLLRQPLAEDGFLAIDQMIAGPAHRVRILTPNQGWLDQRIAVGGLDVTTGMAMQLRAPLVAAGALEGARLGVSNLARGSRIEVRRVATDGSPTLARSAVADRRLRFRIAGLLPGRYTVRVHCARQQRGADGSLTILSPEVTGVVVDCESLTVGTVDATGVRLRRAE